VVVDFAGVAGASLMVLGAACGLDPGWYSSDLEALGGELGKATDGHGVELVSEGEHALVVLGEPAAAGVVVEAAEGLAAERGLGAGLSGGQEAGAEGSGASGHEAPLGQEIRKPAGVAGFFGLCVYFRRLEEIVGQEKRHLESVS
jgi:hypothetical protein